MHFNKRKRWHPCGDHLRSNKIQERTRADQGSALADDPRLLQQDLRGSRSHEAGHGPSGQWHGPFQCSGCQQDTLGNSKCAGAIPCESHAGAVLDLPHHRAFEMRDVIVMQALGKDQVVAVVCAKYIAPDRAGTVDIAVDLPPPQAVRQV